MKIRRPEPTISAERIKTHRELTPAIEVSNSYDVLVGTVSKASEK